MSKGVQMKENKRQHIIEIGKEWLQSHSVDALRIETISKISNVSKTTFYKHFSNKYDFIEVILKQDFESYVNEILGIMDSSKTFEDKIRSTLVIRQEGLRTIGAIAVSIHSSRNPRFEPLKQLLTENTELEDRWRNILIREQQNGNINPHISVDAIVFIERKLNECFFDVDFIAMFPDQVERVNVLTQYWLNGISNKK